MLRTIFMGSPEFARVILDHLCDNDLAPLLVVTQSPKATGRGRVVQPTAVELCAVRREIPVIATDHVNASDVVQKLRSLDPHLILVAAFGQILKEAVLSIPSYFPLNVHGSLLPAYRGAAPLQWAIWNGDEVTGISIQKMVKQLDAGDLLLQRSFSISKDCTSLELFQTAAKIGAECLVEAVKLVQNNRFKLTPQDPKAATYAPKLDRTHSVINWQEPAHRIRNQIRALQPWPVAETRLGSLLLKIFKADLVGESSGAKPGTIHTDSKSFLRVTCGNSSLLSLTEIQLENRKRLDLTSFLRAYRGAFPYQYMGDGS